MKSPRAAPGFWCSGLLAAAIAVVALYPGPPIALAQEYPGPTINDYISDQPSEMSREEWRRKVEEAKRRAREVARERREHPELYVPIPENPDQIATERVLNDDSLQIGDIVATKKGLFVFRGRTDQPRSGDDFVPLSPR